MKKIAIIVPFRDFRDEEYFIPKELFKSKKFKTKTISNESGIAIGADGGEVLVDFSLDKLELDDFDAFVFVGGPGCLKSLNNEKSYDLINEIVKSKVLGAICISPIILSEAGVLKGKKVTVWSSDLDKNPIKILEKNGAIFEDKNVVVDGNIITANGPSSAKEFAQKIIEAIS